MDASDEPTEEIARGLSRRQLLGRVGGGIAGATLLSLGLDSGRSAHAQAGSISLRGLLRRISPRGCDPSHGIRVALPNDRPFISIRSVIQRYAGQVVDYCQPLQLSVRHEQITGGSGGARVYLNGANFTPGSRAVLRFESLVGQSSFTSDVLVQPAGTFAYTRTLECGSPGENRFSVRVSDPASGRSAEGESVSFTCPQLQPTPPPGTRPFITVSQQGFKLTVGGNGFLPNHAVHIRAMTPFLFNFQTTSDGSGGINYRIENVPCLTGQSWSLAANDQRQDQTGTLWSNTVTVTCL